MRSLIQDARYGLRVLLKSPGLTAVATLALGLGVGVNTAVFSLADVLLYRPLLVPDLERLATVHATRKGSSEMLGVSLPDVLNWRAGASTMESLSTVSRLRLSLTGSGEPERLEAARVSPEFFRALGAQLAIGRPFLPQEEEKGRDHVVILTHSLWESRYGKNPEVLKRTIKLEGEEYQIVGVAPKDLEYPNGVQLWVPASFSVEQKSAHSIFSYSLIGRLKPGLSIEQANAEFQSLAQRSEREHPDSHANRSARVDLVRKVLMGPEVEPFMRMLTGAVLFVLLIACADVASLQFARLSGRTHEIAIRSAVGAGRGRLMRQFLMESALLAAVGAAAGIICGYWGTYVLRSSLPANVARYTPGWSRLGIEWHALFYALGVSAAAGIAAGVAPAWFASQTNLVDMLKAGGRGASGTRARRRIRSVLVASQIALTVVLLIGASLMVRGVQHLAEPGQDIHPESVLTLHLELPESRYQKPEQRVRFQEQLLAAFGALPGAGPAAFGSWLPYAVYGGGAPFTVEEQPPPRPGAEPTALLQVVGGAYFQNLRIGLERGRWFDQRDGEGAPEAAVISDHLARRYFPGEDPLGKHLRIGARHAPGKPAVIVGVVADIRLNPWDHDIEPVVYRPFRQAPDRFVHFFLRTTRDPHALMAAAREQVTRLDPDQPVRDIMTYAKVIDDNLVGLRYVATMMAVFGAIGLLLSAAGIYGVMAYSVSERTREIGLRMALGARATTVVWMLGRWGLTVTGVGLAVGVSAALGLANLLQNMLFGVGMYDPASFAGGVMVLLGAVMLACYVPARRALAVDPIVTLRTE